MADANRDLSPQALNSLSVAVDQILNFKIGKQTFRQFLFHVKDSFPEGQSTAAYGLGNFHDGPKQLYDALLMAKVGKLDAILHGKTAREFLAEGKDTLKVMIDYAAINVQANKDDIKLFEKNIRKTSDPYEKIELQEKKARCEGRRPFYENIQIDLGTLKASYDKFLEALPPKQSNIGASR